MVTLITGENSFENERALARIIADFQGMPERIDGEELERARLPDLLMGVSLFTEKRLIIIKNLSLNKQLWELLGDNLARLSDDVHLVLVEPKPDKRTRTFKELQKVAKIVESKPWTDRDRAKAETWVLQEAEGRGVILDKKNAGQLVARVGVDQWLLSHAIEKLAVIGVVTPEIIEEMIEVNPSESVFNLLEAALQARATRIQDMIRIFETTEDPFRLFGLLSSQVFQLAALAVTDKSSAEVAKDLGMHPFAASKLAPYARKLGVRGAGEAIAVFADADHTLKTSAHDPWLVIEQALMRLAYITK